MTNKLLPIATKEQIVQIITRAGELVGDDPHVETINQDDVNAMNAVLQAWLELREEEKAAELLKFNQG
jgi:molecular chaperone DnaK (HSP70)